MGEMHGKGNSNIQGVSVSQSVDQLAEIPDRSQRCLIPPIVSLHPDTKQLPG